MNKVPRTVWALGFVSLCMDLSSELVHGLFPVFMTAVLGASMLAVGVVEGIAEATASIVKVFSGVLSDRLGRRDRKSTRLNSSHTVISYAVFCLKKKTKTTTTTPARKTQSRTTD